MEHRPRTPTVVGPTASAGTTRTMGIRTRERHGSSGVDPEEVTAVGEARGPVLGVPTVVPVASLQRVGTAR